MRWFILTAAFLSGAAVSFLPQVPPGLTYRHDNGLTARRRLPENMGPGVAILDFDGDGRMDVAFPTALFRNEGEGKFRDVTRSAGIDTNVFGIGIGAADYDRDGDIDLLVSAWGRPILYRNRGDGTFARQAFAAEGLWTAVVFFDADGDGWQDLFLGHFARYDPRVEPECKYGGDYHYCHPLSYPPEASRLYRNRRDGSFEDVSVASGVAAMSGKAFGAVATDVNGDGRLDLFVANDSVANFLWVNQGGMKFEEMGLEAGVAYSADGNPRSGMGVDAADYDGDGREDLFVANFNRERFSIYRNLGDGTFRDEAGVTGIGMATQMYSGWGVKFADLDLDGDEDLTMCNGHPDDRIERLSKTLTYREPVLVGWNEGGKFRVEVSAEQYPARGLAMGDLNDDGALDVVIANNGTAPVVSYGVARGNHWVGLNVAGLQPGAKVRWKAGGSVRQRRVNGGGSYLSGHDPRLVLGLGRVMEAEWVELEMGGRVVRLEHLKADRYHAVRF